MLHSIGAVLAGYLAMAIVVMLGTATAAFLLMPGVMGQGMQLPEGRVVPATYLTANLLVSLLAAALGGYITARIAAASPSSHVVALALLGLVMSLLYARQAARSGTRNGQPSWYPKVLPAIMVTGVLAGGMILAKA